MVDGSKRQEGVCGTKAEKQELFSFFFFFKTRTNIALIPFNLGTCELRHQHRTADFFCPETSILRLAGHQFLSVPREAGKCMLRVGLMGSDRNSISRPVSSEEGQFQKSPPSSRLVPLNHFCCFCLVERVLKNTSIIYVHIR